VGEIEAVSSSGVQNHKPHFAVLDGLRGVAALCVVIFHFAEMVIGNYSQLWIGHGWLAVDFFFCLSGFVIGYAYDDRLTTIGLVRFFKARLIRLHPMVVLGSVLGLIAFYANPFSSTAANGSGTMAVIFLASILMIPFGSIHDRGHSIFGLNAPAWSLFWEYVANIAFAVVLYRLRRNALVVFTLVFAALLCWASHRAGNIYGGWSTRSFWDGGVRVAFSFSAGLLVYRTKWLPRSPFGFISLSALLTTAFMMPYADGAWIREDAVIIAGFPLLVALGAGSVVTPRIEKLCRISGNISYPLYMTHYTVIWIWGGYADRHHLYPSASLWLTIALGTSITVAFAWVVFKLYDEPVRQFLRTRFST
jgi:peptidoglycan/LPS O-acetylase OafA/YrhL